MNELMQKIMLMIDELDEGVATKSFIELTLYSDWSGHLTHLHNENEKISFDDLTSVYELLVKEVEERKNKV